MIKNFLFCAFVLSSCLPNYVLANETPIVEKPKASSFEGIFVGVNVGHASGQHKISHDINNSPIFRTIPLRNDLATAGIDKGIHVGYSHAFDNIVLGLEGVYNFPHMKGRWNIDGFDEKVHLAQSIQVRGSLGYVFCNMIMPKIIVGWHNTHWKRDHNFCDLTHVKSKKRHDNLLWGVGVDVALRKHWLAGVEYTRTVGVKKENTLHTGHKTSFNPTHNKFALVFKFIC